MRFLMGFGGYLRSNHPLATMLLLLVEFFCYFRCVDYWKLLDVYLFRFYHLGQVHDLLLGGDEGTGEVLLGVVEQGEILCVLELETGEVFLEREGKG